MNTAKHLRRSGLYRPDAPAVAHGKQVVSTYGQLADRAARLAAALTHRFGLQCGERVALTMKNCVQYYELVFACWHAGLVAVPMNAKLHPDEFAYMFAHSGARLGFATPDLVESVAGTGELEHVIEVPSADYQRLLAHAPMAMIDRAPDDPAWLFYTSGTTGRPKGATISHRNITAMCGSYFTDVDPSGPWNAILHAAPMSHGSGLYGVAHVIQASCHVIPESAGFTPAEIFELIEHYPGASFFAAPTMVRRLLDHKAALDTGKLKSIFYGGGPMYVADCLEALERFGDQKLTQLYGQGESPMTITALNAAMHAERSHPRWLERLASVGIAQSAVEVRVADAEDRTVACGELGEVLVRGDAVMLGYWNNPEASAETLRGGWLHTGDVGSMDEGGFLTLKDRSKDMIISGGTNIYPREVEEVILRHADVAEVSVIGRADREWGEVVVAFVVPQADVMPDVAALDAFCKDNMARFKRPKDYKIVAALPKNNYGKVLKTALRALDEASRQERD